MLNRSFRPAKCKTALKLAVSRIKLLKNKREVQVKQLRRELAKLLESGQDLIARIRVEHVVREEKTMAAYDLIEIYCELIAARLPIIESQKNCPVDLKEAISSVIFASPRCADIPELLDVRKHITAKYGKELISAAIELRPECGVNRLLVEKLSAKAPDGPTKIKILNAIAEEHNVRWELKSFGENDVKFSHDLQIGPNNYEKASYVELPQAHIPTPPVRDEKGPSNLHASSQHKEMDDVPTNLHQHNASFAAELVGGSGNRSSTSSRSNPYIKSSGTGSQEMDFRDSHSENKISSRMGRQNWNMEFKDAASAAQAAAESAERASVAARAAAELSNREKITRQYSTGLQNSSGSDLGDEVPQEYAFHDGKHLSAESFNSNYGKHNEQISAREPNNPVGVPDQNYRSSRENVVKHAKSASLMSIGAFGDDIDNPFSYGSEMANAYPHDNSSEQENNDNFGDGRMSRQSSKAASHSQVFSPSDDHNDILERNSRKMGNNVAAGLFVTDEENTHRRNFKEINSYNRTDVIFDDSGSEDGDFKFPVDYKYDRQGSASFGDSDAPSSESEEDLVKPKVAANANHSRGNSDPILSTKQKHGTSGSSSMNDETVDSHWKSKLWPSSVGSDTMDVEHFKRKIDITTVSENIFAYDYLTESQPSSKVSSSKDASLSKSIPASKRSSHEAKAKVQHSNSLPKTVKPDRSEALESSTSGGTTPSKKASHVHPKLPDYDSFTAHFLSLKKGRQ